MFRKQLLHAVWRGEIRLASGEPARRLARMVFAILPVRAIFLIADTDEVDHIHSLTDASLVLPDLPLGDVLDEELGIDVPDGAMIFVLPADAVSRRASSEALSATAGAAVISALSTLAESRRQFQEPELEALAAVARFYRQLPAGFLSAHPGLDPGGFRAGADAAFRRNFGALSASDAPQPCADPAFGAGKAAVRASALSAIAASGWEMERDLFAQIAFSVPEPAVAAGQVERAYQRRAI